MTDAAPDTIQPLVPDQFEAWMPLWEGYQRFYRVAIPHDTTLATWKRLLDPAEPMAGFLAWSGDGRAVGMVHWVRHRSTWTVGDYAYLQDLFVVAGHRGHGTGRALIERVYAEADAAGCARVHWLTHESNGDAMLLYDRIAERSGFVQYRKLFR